MPAKQISSDLQDLSINLAKKIHKTGEKCKDQLITGSHDICTYQHIVIKSLAEDRNINLREEMQNRRTGEYAYLLISVAPANEDQLLIGRIIYILRKIKTCIKQEKRRVP